MIVVSIVFYFIQDKMIFYPRGITKEDLVAINKLGYAEAVSIKTSDGNDIKGWVVRNSPEKPNKTVFYFGGNAEEVSHMIPLVARFDGCRTVLMNYRGYGQSRGKPSEKNLCHDALEIYDRFSGNPDNKGLKIIVMGRSIGTGVAVDLASKRKCDGLILVSPYNDLRSLAKIHFPYLPVNLIVRYKFDSGAKAPHLKVPLLAVVGSSDNTIPPSQSRQLINKWGGTATIKEFPGADHNNLSSSEDYWKTIQDFINTI